MKFEITMSVISDCSPGNGDDYRFTWWPRFRNSGNFTGETIVQCITPENYVFILSSESRLSPNVDEGFRWKGISSRFRPLDCKCKGEFLGDQQPWRVGGFTRSPLWRTEYSMWLFFQRSSWNHTENCWRVNPSFYNSFHKLETKRRVRSSKLSFTLLNSNEC